MTVRESIKKEFFPGRMVTTGKNGPYKVFSGIVLEVAENGLDVVIQTAKKKETFFHALLSPVQF